MGPPRPGLICPDCTADLDGEACAHCGWKAGHIDGITEYLSTRDRSSPLFGDYVTNYDAIAAADLDASIQPARRLREAARHCARIVGTIDGASVCEVGIGQGMLLEELSKKAPASIVGIDISTGYLRRHRDRVTVLVANAENLPYREAFDVLVATDILEHVIRPGDFLLAAHRALKPGGRFVVRVPLSESLVPYAHLAGCPYEFVHLRAYTPRLLRQELRDAGFRVRRVVSAEHRDGRARRPFRPRYVEAALHRLRPYLGGPASLAARLPFQAFTGTAVAVKRR